eukprot:scaffold153709_cov50-Cyclotella_meneghiniana.AAC.1
MPDEFKSQPCKTIPYTSDSDETLERWRCCEQPESVQTYSFLLLVVYDRELELEGSQSMYSIAAEKEMLRNMLMMDSVM